MRRFLLCLLIALTARAAEVLDNATVVRLTAAGLAPDVIVLKVEQSDGVFDTSADGLIALKKAGVADVVIKAMMLKAPAPIPAPVVRAAVPTGCVTLESYALGNNGWSWVPATVCVSANELSLDEQSFHFSDLKVQCVEGAGRTWRWSDGKESFQVRGKGDDVKHLSDALAAAAPSVRHGSCGDLRALLKTR